MVQHRQHVAIVTDLLVANGVLVIGLLGGNLIPHLGKEHADARVGLNEVLELLQNGDEALGVLVGMVDLLLQPLLVDAAVGREPCAGPVELSVVVGRGRDCFGRNWERLTCEPCARSGRHGGHRAVEPWLRYCGIERLVWEMGWNY